MQFCEQSVYTDIDIKHTNDGMECKVICPICGIEKALSPYVCESSGKISFSVYNFKRHYNTMHQSGKESSSTQFEFSLENASTPIPTSQESSVQETRSNCECCDLLKKDLTDRETELTTKIKSFNDLEKIIAEKGK